MKKTVILLAITILLVTNLLSCCLFKSDDGNSDRENADVIISSFRFVMAIIAYFTGGCKEF